MSNYTKENLIAIPPASVPAGTLAIKVGDDIFTPGNIRIGNSSSVEFYKCASVSLNSESFIRVSEAVSEDCNGDYYPTGEIKNDQPVYSYVSKETNRTFYIYYWVNEEEGETWVLDTNKDLYWNGEAYYYSESRELNAVWVAGEEGNGVGTANVALTEGSSEKTWTGYKAVLTDGVYTFEETVTTGLTYGTAYTPVVGKIYSTDATVFVSSLWSGVPLADLFSADLLSDVSATPTLSMYGNITFGTKAGKQCAIFDGNSCLYNKTWSFSGPFSVSLSVYWESGSEQSILGIGNHQSNNNFELLSKNGVPTIYVMYGADNMELSAASNVTDQWAHIVMTFDGTTRQIYVNKILENSGDVTFTGNQGIVLGSLYGNGTYDSFRDGYMTGGMRYVRVFNRVLTQEEIDQLYTEQV